MYPRPVPVVVTTAGGVSEPVLTTVVPDASGIFTQTWRGCGQGLIQNIASDGDRTLNTSDHSASPGSFVSVYATGFGIVNFPPPDGEPAQLDPPARGRGEPVVLLGPEGFARQARLVTFSGRAPGLIGVDQVDVQIPDTAPEGCAVPLRFWTGTQASQPVAISIHRGGGACEDAPPARFGSILWKRKVVSGPETGAITSNDTFTASFSEAPSNQAAPQVPASSSGLGLLVSRAGSSAGWPALSWDGPAWTQRGADYDWRPAAPPITVNSGLSFGEIAYTAALPAGSVQPGAVQVEAAGGSVGAFQTGITIPPPIQITTPLSPGTTIPNDQPFTVRWTGGSPDALVRMQVISENIPNTGDGCECSALVSDQQVTMGCLAMVADLPTSRWSKGHCSRDHYGDAKTWPGANDLGSRSHERCDARVEL